MTDAETRFRLTFSVPDDPDIQEVHPEGQRFTGDPLPSPLLEVLRGALAADARWTLARVSPLPPDANGDQPLFVWVTTSLPASEAEIEIRTGVYDLVTNVLNAATLRHIVAET
jgi:hypothetical protein